MRTRLQYQLEAAPRRIHILEGFKAIFDALDEAIRIIRRSDGKADAAGKLMKRFSLDDVQVDADPRDEALQARAAGDRRRFGAS